MNNPGNAAVADDAKRMRHTSPVPGRASLRIVRPYGDHIVVCNTTTVTGAGPPADGSLRIIKPYGDHTVVGNTPTTADAAPQAHDNDTLHIDEIVDVPL